MQISPRLEKPKIIQATALYIGDGLFLAAGHSFVYSNEMFQSMV
jgi:hypothetical protein